MIPKLKVNFDVGRQAAWTSHPNTDDLRCFDVSIGDKDFEYDDVKVALYMPLFRYYTGLPKYEVPPIGQIAGSFDLLKNKLRVQLEVLDKLDVGLYGTLSNAVIHHLVVSICTEESMANIHYAGGCWDQSAPMKKIEDYPIDFKEYCVLHHYMGCAQRDTRSSLYKPAVKHIADITSRLCEIQDNRDRGMMYARYRYLIVAMRNKGFTNWCMTNFMED